MKKEFRVVQGGIVQVTTVDERWYAIPTRDEQTGLPESYRFVPSVTWIAGHYPKGIGFYKWLADKGWDESQAIKVAAGDKGSRVHHAVQDLIDGARIPMDARYAGGDEGSAELSLEEYDCLRSFVDFWTACKPITLAREVTVVNAEHNYAGTLDWCGMLQSPPKGVSVGPWILDWKTSKDVWPEHEIQVSAYRHSDWIREFQRQDPPENVKALATLAGDGGWHLGILQLGYRRNKAGWKLTEVEDQFPLFLAAQQIWASECGRVTVPTRDYPLALELPPPPATVAP